jgi:pimeloyl-ACP methyl ester carboxylesterase
MRQIIAAALFVLIAIPGQGQETSKSETPLQGLWLGKMQVSEQMSLQLAFEIELIEEGAYAAKMNVIEQKALDIPMNACTLSDDSIHIRFDAAGIAYDGHYSHSEDKIFGAYSQGGGSFTLDLTRVDKLPLEVERPQTPVRPFPYEEEEVTFLNNEAGIKLAGTFTKPTDGQNLTAVVLIAGSGRNDRNETGMGHFLLLSDYLTRHGYAVLRYDKRGAGESEGDYGAATTFDFTEDAKAALDYLNTRSDIDHQSIGIIGHSEGALIAPMIAAESKEAVAFIVMMGGIGVRGSELLLLQSGKMAAIQGAPDEEISEMIRKNRILYEIAGSSDSDSIVAKKLSEADPGIENNDYNGLLWTWFRTFLSLEPDTYLSKVTCPVLAINGEKDVQCPPEENLAAIKQSLQKAGNESYVVKTLPGLNHLFQTAESGSPYEYEQIAEIISPDALDLIREWMDINAK